MDSLLHFLFWSLVENVFFRWGRMLLRIASLGRIRVETPTPLQVFVLAAFGCASLVFAALAVLKWMKALPA